MRTSRSASVMWRFGDLAVAAQALENLLELVS